MNNISIRYIFATVFYASVLAAVFFGSSISAEAATIPPSCNVPPTVGGFTPYIYDGVLNSFDYMVVGDGTVSATETTISGKAIEFNFVTIWDTAQPNIKKVHVDVPSWYGFSGETKIAVKFMTATNAACAGQKEFVVNLPVHPLKQALTSVKTPTVSHETSSKADVGAAVSDTQTPNVEGVPAAQVSAEEDEAGSCTSWPSSTWILLVIICVAAVFVIIDSLPYLLAGNGVRFAVALLAMFLIFLGLWFVFDQCRHFRWFPIAVTLLSLGTLIMPTTLEGQKGRNKKLPF